ncbi:MAG: glycolate oxidase subunit GlcE [Gammaproteobacteria bacterium]
MNEPRCEFESKIQRAIGDAAAGKQPVRIRGTDSKQFFGRIARGKPLETGAHRGVLEYEPSELVLTARCGTPLAEVETVLAVEGQMLAFEPPYFGDSATLGGTIACGLSGPRRAYVGAVRDFVLGVRMINGKAEVLSFGGQVIKNVAGYDISRLMVGALGTLGVILEVSLKVLPKPAAERTLIQACSDQDALTNCKQWTGRALPISATCFYEDKLYVRLAGTEETLNEAQRRIGGDLLDGGDSFWEDLREHRHPFLSAAGILWRLSVAPGTPMLPLQGKWLLEWGGAQRWLRTDLPADEVRREALAAGGHAHQFRGGDRQGDVFHPLAREVAAIHQRLKTAFDPQHIFNPGRMYRDL